MATRPTVVVLAAASVDGRIALGPNRTMFEEWDDPRGRAAGASDIWNEVEARLKAIHNPQASMLGSGSLVREGEELRPLQPAKGDTGALYEDFLPDEIVHHPDHREWLVGVDGRGRLRSGYKGTENPGYHSLHLTSCGAPPEYLAFLRHERIPYLLAGEGRVDLPGALAKLRAKLGVTCLISQAAGKLNGALLRAGLVDEINLIVNPLVIGGFETPSLFDSPELGPEEWPVRLKLLSAQVQTDGPLWLRYQVVRDEAGGTADSPADRP